MAKTREQLEEERYQRDYAKVQRDKAAAAEAMSSVFAQNNANEENLSYRTEAVPVAPTAESTQKPSDEANTNGNLHNHNIPGGKTYGGDGFKVTTYAGGTIDGNVDSYYYEAENALRLAQGGMPTYTGSYDAMLNDAYNKIVGRAPFEYDIASDPMYQQYMQEYMRQGDIASEDAMGQAAAMTGGYASSYGQAVGTQAYQNFIQQGNDRIADFYGMALDKYNAEGNALAQEYSMARDLADREYAIYEDELDQYWKNLSYQQSLEDRAYERNEAAKNELLSYGVMGYDVSDAELEAVGLSREMLDAYINYANSSEAEGYDLKTARSNLIDLIKAGYDPTDDELSSVGMTREQANAYRNKYYTEEESPKLKNARAHIEILPTQDDIIYYIANGGFTTDEQAVLYNEYVIEEMPYENRQWTVVEGGGKGDKRIIEDQYGNRDTIANFYNEVLEYLKEYYKASGVNKPESDIEDEAIKIMSTIKANLH